MAEFGNLTSADVKLWLTGPNEEKYKRNPVYLHSVILKRSEFFQVKKSERWSSDKPSEIRVTTYHNFDDYLKRIQLMYGKRVYFSKAEECMAILSVASELLVDDCINKCMEYLEAVPWNAEQESRIGDVLSCLGLKFLPDLAARLDKEDDEHIIFVERMINQMVSIIKIHEEDSQNWETAEKYIVGIFEGNASRDVVEVCKRVLLEGFKSSIHSRNFASIRSLFKFIGQRDGDILKDAFIAFCEDSKFWEDYVAKEYHGEDVFYTIMWFMKAIRDGKIIISRDSRISFLTNWLPIMAGLCKGKLAKFGELDKAVLNIVESLPLPDKKRICVEWTNAYNGYTMDITTPFTLFKDLQDAHYKSTLKRNYSSL